MHLLTDWSITSVQLTSVFWFTYQGKTKTYFQSVQKKPKQDQTPKAIFIQKQEINSLQFLFQVG